MTVVFVIVISMVSTIVSRFKYYTPIKDLLNSKGYFYYIDNAINPQTGATLRETEELYELLDGEENILAAYTPWLSYVDDSSAFVSYDDAFIECYTPDLESGQWFDLSMDQSEVVQVVVSQNPYGFKVGDIIEFDNGYGYTINAEIIGILKEGTKLMGFTVPADNKYDCQSAYISYSYEIEEKTLFIFSQKGLIDKEIVIQLDGPVFVTFPEDTTNEALENNNSIMKQMMTLSVIPLNEMKSNSMDFIFSQLYTLFPILVCILILTLVGAISTSALSAKRQLRNYAVYYICGLKWKQCAVINLFSSLICILISFALSIIAAFIAKATGILGDTVISLGVWQILGCVVIMIIYVLFSIILPLNIIGNNTPNKILKSN
ncbi:MAG: hypothetical protein LUG91_07620 [Ruminococcus sp.]|nr:hypothetical protein [Ruminococcus sp.]